MQQVCLVQSLALPQSFTACIAHCKLVGCFIGGRVGDFVGGLLCSLVGNFSGIDDESDNVSKGTIFVLPKLLLLLLLLPNNFPFTLNFQ